MSWNSLHHHSQYSILDALGSTEKLIHRASEYKCNALALTDNGNLFGAVEFFQGCLKQEIKPIIGCEFYIAPEKCSEKKQTPGIPNSLSVVLLAKVNAILP